MPELNLVPLTSRVRRGAPDGGRYWLAIATCTLIVASEYKWRVRSADSGLTGSLDITTAVELSLYALTFMSLVLRSGKAPSFARAPSPLAWACAYVSYLTLSVAWSPFYVVAAVRAAEMITVLLLCWVACSRANLADFRRTSDAFLGLTVLSVFVGVVFKMPSLPLQQGRFTWLMVHPTSAAVFLGVATLTSIHGLLRRTGQLKRSGLYATSLVITVAGLIASHTRGAIFGVVAGILALVAVQPRRHRLVPAIASVWLLSMTALTSLSSVGNYLARGESATQLATLNDRTDLWGVALSAVSQQPLFGYGLYSSRGIFIDTTGLGGGHNAIVNVVVDLGCVGLVLWVALILSVTKCIGRSLRMGRRKATATPGDASLLLGLLVFFLVDGISIAGVGAVSDASVIWLFVIVAWAVRLCRDEPQPRRGVRPAGLPIHSKTRARVSYSD